MEATAPKRKEPRKPLRIKVISMGNAEVGKVRRRDWLAGGEGQARWPIGERAAPRRRSRIGRRAGKAGSQSERLAAYGRVGRGFVIDSGGGGATRGCAALIGCGWGEGGFVRQRAGVMAAPSGCHGGAHAQGPMAVTRPRLREPRGPGGGLPAGFFSQVLPSPCVK